MARTTAPSTKARVGLAAGFRGAVIEAFCISLPYFYQRIADWCAYAIDDMALDSDAFACRLLIIERAGAEILLENAVDANKIGCQSDMDVRARSL